MSTAAIIINQMAPRQSSATRIRMPMTSSMATKTTEKTMTGARSMTRSTRTPFRRCLA